MDDQELPENAPWPPDDEEMVMPSPTSDPWAGSTHASFPSSVFAPGELGDMSLFPDFRPIQSPTAYSTEDFDRNHGEPLILQSEKMRANQQGSNYRAESPDVFAEFTWEDGLHAIEDFDWSVPESPGKGNDSIQDATKSPQEVHDNSYHATATKQDPIMEDVSEEIVCAPTDSTLKEAPVVTPQIQPSQPDMTKETVAIATKLASPTAPGFDMHNENASGSDLDEKDEQLENTSLEREETKFQPDMDTISVLKEGKQIDLPWRSKPSTADEWLAEQSMEGTTSQGGEPDEGQVEAHVDRQELPSKVQTHNIDIAEERPLQIARKVDNESNPSPESKARSEVDLSVSSAEHGRPSDVGEEHRVAEAQHGARNETELTLPVVEAEAEMANVTDNMVEHDTTAEEESNGLVPTATSDVTPAEATPLAPLQSAAELIDYGEQLQAIKHTEIDSSTASAACERTENMDVEHTPTVALENVEIVPNTASAAHERMENAETEPTPELAVSSPGISEGQDVEYADRATGENQHHTTTPQVPGMQVVLLPEANNSADVEDDQDMLDAPTSTTPMASIAKRTRSAIKASSSSDSDVPSKKKAKKADTNQAEITSLDRLETSAAASPEAEPKHRTSLKSPKESAQDTDKTVSTTPGTNRDEVVLSNTPGQPNWSGEGEKHPEEEVASVQHDSAVTKAIARDDAAKRIETEASTDNEYDMHEHFSDVDVQSSPAKPSPKHVLPTPRAVTNSVSNYELTSLSSNLTSRMHVDYGGPATRTRKPAVRYSSGYYNEDEEDEEDGPMPIASKKKCSSTASKKSFPAAKKAKTQPSRKRAATEIKSEQRRRGVSEVDEDDGEDAANMETLKAKKKASTPTAASEPRLSPKVIISKPPATGKKTSRAAPKITPKKQAETTVPDGNDADDDIAEVDEGYSPIEVPDNDNDNDEDKDFLPSPAPPSAPAPARPKASAKKAPLRGLAPKPVPAPPPPPPSSTPSALEAAKRKKFGFKPSPRKSPRNTRSRAVKGKDVAESSTKSKGKAGEAGRGSGSDRKQDKGEARDDEQGSGGDEEKEKDESGMEEKDKEESGMMEEEEEKKQESGMEEEEKQEGGMKETKMGKSTTKEKSGAKGKAKAVEEGPKTRGAAKKEKRSLRSGG